MTNPPGRKYRVHVHDHLDGGRWLASADFAERPLPDEIDARLPVLRKPGRYEVRVCRLHGGEEYHLYAWLRGEHSPPSRC